MLRRRVIPCLLAAPVLACASAGPGGAKVDLGPARAAIEKAREVGAAEKAPDSLARAEGHLKQAEAAAVEPGRAQQASCLADLAEAEAECSTRLSWVQAEADRLPEAQQEAAGEAERLAARTKKAEDEQRRLEDRVAVLMRDLELTETEVIRIKARLQGLETKADATSVIAETRVLIRRLQDQRGRTPAVVRSLELLNRSEQMVEEGNFGAATFLALKAQELLKDLRRVGEEPDRPAPKRQYTVTAERANLRGGPAKDAPLVGSVKKGDVLEAVAQRGEWLQVKLEDKKAWISRSLVE